MANRPEELEKLSEDEVRILNDMTATHVAKISAEKSIDDLAKDVFDGLTPRLQRGCLGLQKKVPEMEGKTATANGEHAALNGEGVTSRAEPVAVKGEVVGWPEEIEAH